MSEIVKLELTPKITHRIDEVAQEVKQRIDNLNIEKLVATDQTLKSLKNLRAELNKELATFETQRKAIKTAVLKPYTEFEILYNPKIKQEYETAVLKLSEGINSVEIELREARKEKLQAYFEAQRVTTGYTFLEFDKMNLNITLSPSDKSFIDQIDAFFEKTTQDLALIDTQENKDKILAEYKMTLNVSQAIVTVTDRLKREAMEAQAVVPTEPETQRVETPKITGPQKILTARIEITGTAEQLGLLKEFLTVNKINYTNI